MSTTDLAARMRLHVPGQITWPEPLLGKTCADCDHFQPWGKAPPPEGQGQKGRCALVRGHQAVSGKLFVGADATACPKWREVAA